MRVGGSFIGGQGQQLQAFEVIIVIIRRIVATIVIVIMRKVNSNDNATTNSCDSVQVASAEFGVCEVSLPLRPPCRPTAIPLFWVMLTHCLFVSFVFLN